MERIVIAGATGYLGSHLVRQAAARGLHVRAIARPGKEVPGAHEVWHGLVTEPQTLRGAFEGMDAAFSALGITRQKDKVTFEDIEYTANLHLLEQARAAGVRRFGVISGVRPELFEGLAILASREKFITALKASDMPSTVVRATGFFSDLSEVFDMAASGRAWLLGDGTARVNPIHGADLADACLDAMASGVEEISVGGPDVLSWNEIAALAFEALGRSPRITHLPAGLLKALLPLVRPLHRRTHDLASFFLRGATADMVAEPTGTHRLANLYRELAHDRVS